MKQIILSKRPEGLPDLETFHFQEVPLPDIQEGQVRLKTLYISVDPYMRGRMSTQKSYIPPFEVGKPIVGGVIAEVVESRGTLLKAGDMVVGDLPWQTEHVTSERYLKKIDPELAPITAHLGVLGLTGLTAYFGLLDIGKPKPGETVVVSGGAGAVGSSEAQIAKIKGARAVGIAGSVEKCRFLTEELGFDAALNYKDPDFYNQLKAATPNGVDVYFDNVGGIVSDLVLRRINTFARIPVCGQIALYNLQKQDVGPRVQTLLVINRALMKGFIVTDYQKEFGTAYKDLTQWVKSGQLKSRETIVEGFEQVPKAFLGLFSGDNIGKYLVKIS
ncbi:MAG: NADP-dependent oxidoreductase [Tuberibacillus sp.]